MASWNVRFAQAGRYRVKGAFAAGAGDSRIAVTVGNQALSAVVPHSEWDDFHEVDLGTLEVTSPGGATVAAKPYDKQTWKPVNLRGLAFERQ